MEVGKAYISLQTIQNRSDVPILSVRVVLGESMEINILSSYLRNGFLELSKTQMLEVAEFEIFPVNNTS